MDKARNGTKVVFVPGNHDEDLRQFCGMNLENLEIREEAEYETVNGKKILLLHGDKFDSNIKCGRLKKFIGSFLYESVVVLSNTVHKLRHRLGFGFWSLSVFIKTRVRDAVDHIRTFEEAAAHEAKSRGFDGVVCGHIHHPAMKEVDDVLYMNDGDWVENCTALVEQFDGTMELLHWTEKKHSLSTHRPVVAEVETTEPDKVA
jgi:UDP-2,3-diacylglucosamine pyrophosphatase LpxH